MKPRHLAAALGAVIVLIVARPTGGAQLLSAFVFHDEGQPPLLFLRWSALFFALYVLRRERASAAVVIALFSLSLIVRGALYPFLLVAAGLVARRREDDRLPYLVLYGTLAAALLLAVTPHLKRPAQMPDERDPARMVAYWQARHNSYQARWWALAWTRREANDHGDGYLALAAIDWELGREVQARKVLAKVIDGPSSDAARARATAQRALWDAQKPEAR